MGYFIAGYFAVSILSSLIGYLKREFFKFVKPIPVTILIIYTAISLDWKIFNICSILLIAALILGLIGDIILLNRNLTLPGLISFLLGHLIFIYMMFRYDSMIMIYIAVVIFAFPMILTLILFLMMNNNTQKAMGIPVIIYGAVLSVMLIAAVNADVYGIKDSLYLFTIGTVFFILSDILLGYQKFVKQINCLTIPIHILYYSAQLTLAIRFLMIINYL